MASNINPDKMSYVYNSQLDAFTLYHVSQESEEHSAVGPALPALGHATSGALGTVISKLITYPLELVITRLQVQRQLHPGDKHPHYNGFLDALEKIYEREGGPKAFYTGVVPAALKGVADSFLFFLAYSYVRQKRLNARDGGRNLPALEEIGVGVLAGAFSKFFTTPIQQIITRKQTAAMMRQESSTTIPPLTSTRDIAWEIRREKGLQGFWSGYSASLILTLNPSITMLLHKALIRLVVPRAKRDDPGARMTFLLAAISKVLASTATYPFSLAKSRAQVSAQEPSSGIGETSDKEKSNDALGSRALQARQRTVFSTILRIAQTEGILGLYQGLGAEVVKGFFSHGITMLMKDRIHAVIISLYYTVQSALKKYPSPSEVAKSASDSVQKAYEQSKEQASEAYAKGAEVVGNATESAKQVVSQGSQEAQELVEKGRQHAADAYSKGAQAAETATASAQDAVHSGTQQAGQVYEKSKEVVGEAASSVYDQSKDVLDKGQDAASNATQQTGDALQQANDSVLEADIRDINGPDKGIKE